jgi:CxxC motif-containing protein (DUF1111 family)
MTLIYASFGKYNMADHVAHMRQQGENESKRWRTYALAGVNELTKSYLIFLSMGPTKAETQNLNFIYFSAKRG